FIRQQFFTVSGTTDMILFFSVVLYISIIAVPALCYKQSLSVYDDFIPRSSLQRMFISWLTHLVLFSIQIVLMIPAILVVNLFGTTDGGQIFTSFLCLFFYGAAVISLCTFIQTAISNKVSSLIISALVLAIFNSAHLFAVYVNLPSALTSLARSLSFAWHFDAAGKGIFDSRDIFWFCGLTALFIFLSNFVEDKKKGRQFSKNLKIRNILLILISLLLMLNANRWYKRIDFSKNRTYSISKYTKSLTDRIESPVKITYYRSSSIAKLYPQIRDVADFLTEYSNLNRKISLIIKDPDKDSQSRTMLENYGIASQQLRTVSGTSTEFLTVYSAIIIECEGNAETIPFTMAANTLEYDLDGRLRHLLSGNSRTVNIVAGNGLSLSEDYSYVIPWLQSQGFECNPLYIENPSFADQLSHSNGPLLVFGDGEIKIEEAIAIEDYILSGRGAALFAISPFVTDIENSWNLTNAKKTNLIELAEHWGLTFENSIAADISCARITMYADDNNQTKLINYPLWISLLPQENTSLGMTLFWASPLTITGENVNVKPYLFTSPAAYYYEIDSQSPEKLIETNPFIIENASKSPSAPKGSLTLGAEITGPLKGLYNLESTQNSHIIVISDQYFATSLMNGYIGGENGDYRNFEFLTNALLKLNGEEELAALQSRSSRDTSLYKVTDLASFNTFRLISYIILFVIVPFSIIAVGVILNVRKEK
nr:GldG family protein [Treponema sp.]